jgi:hypothetical protein
MSQIRYILPIFQEDPKNFFLFFNYPYYYYTPITKTTQ